MIRSSRQKSCGPARRHLAATRLACRLGVTNDKTQGEHNASASGRIATKSQQAITFHTNTKNTPSGQPERRLHLAYEKDVLRQSARYRPENTERQDDDVQTMTYKEVASKAGNPKAARAVGAVMRSNYDPSIPCHRVVASDGKMRGYNRGARIR